MDESAEHLIAQWRSTYLCEMLKEKPKTVEEFFKRLEQEKIEILLILRNIVNNEFNK